MNASYTVKKRRKREGKTDYKKRISLISSGKPWMIVRKTSNKIITSIAKFNMKGDEMITTCTSTELQKYGWKGSFKNIPAAYLTGYLLGKKAQENNINDVVYDIGLQTSHPGGKIYAALKGAIDAGLNLNCKEEVFPDEKRIKGEHIKDNKDDVEEIKKKISG